MIKINFLPESDLLDFSKAVKEFEDIWSKEGESIVNKWEEVTGFEFYETNINAVVADVRSCSHPLTLRHANEFDFKRSTLVHELGHRILYKRVKGMGQKTSFERHKFLFLVLYDVFVELYGEKYTQKVIDWDSQLQNDISRYGEAWTWVLQYKDKTERQKMFKEIVSGQYDL